MLKLESLCLLPFSSEEAGIRGHTSDQGCPLPRKKTDGVKMRLRLSWKNNEFFSIEQVRRTTDPGGRGERRRGPVRRRRVSDRRAARRQAAVGRIYPVPPPRCDGRRAAPPPPPAPRSGFACDDDCPLLFSAAAAAGYLVTRSAGRRDDHALRVFPEVKGQSQIMSVVRGEGWLAKL